MTNTKRQVLPPGLWVVATPIGNLEDLTPRARQALEEASAILCEDTRRTAQLLSAIGIAGKELVRLDAHVEREAGRLARIVERLEAGESLALVTDAGTPGISDPGQALVRSARERGVRVTPLPGVSAPVALLSAGGLEGTAFTFRGFFPRKAGERDKEIELARGSGASRVFVWFESPERVAESLALVARAVPQARAVAAKELTKLHERFFAGDASEVAHAVEREIAAEGARGEWCFAIEVNDERSGAESESSDWVKALHCLIDARVPASEAARRVSQHFGVSRKTVYGEALRVSGKKSGEGD